MFELGNIPFRSKNKIHLRGLLISDITKVEDGFLFKIFTEVRHDGKVYDTDVQVWAGKKLGSILSVSKRGHTVDIEGALSKNQLVIAMDFNNVTREQERIQQLARQASFQQPDET
jgi:hypothetical protein